MSQAKDTKQSFIMDSEAIKKVLPHRYPFLLVDRILEIKDRVTIGIKNVSITESFFQGHFPQKPVMPGVLIVEALAQTAGVLLLSKPENKGKLAYLAGITRARFRRTVVPGDTLRLETEIVKMKAKMGVCKAVAKVGNEVACEAEILFVVS